MKTIAKILAATTAVGIASGAFAADMTMKFGHVSAPGSLVPVYDGFLIKEDGIILGAVGFTGDSSDNNDVRAIAAIAQAGFVTDGG